VKYPEIEMGSVPSHHHVNVWHLQKQNKNDESKQEPPRTLKFCPSQNKLVAHSARSILLTCMDFRFQDDINEFMKEKGYDVNYDHFVLAGASLGVNQKKYASWHELWNQHVTLAESLHHVEEVVCIDHEKCGAYRMFYPDMKPEEEKSLHDENLAKFVKIVQEEHPNLRVKGFFMHLNGSVEHVIECCPVLESTLCKEIHADDVVDVISTDDVAAVS